MSMDSDMKAAIREALKAKGGKAGQQLATSELFDILKAVGTKHGVFAKPSTQNKARGGVATKRMRGGGMAKVAKKKMARGGVAKKKMMRGGVAKKKAR